MKHSQSLVNVVRILRDFLQNEARTIEISKGKMLRDEAFDTIVPKYMKVG